MKRFILFHVYPVRFYQEIVNELTRLIDASGLSQEAELIFSHADKEWLSINRLRELAFERPGEQALYIHTKGVTHSYYQCAIHDWRKFMAYFLIERWRDCVQKLDEGYDTVGCNWVEKASEDNANFLWITRAAYLKYYSGNFFWATTDYLGQLRPLPVIQHRGAAEAWIGGRLTLPDGSCVPPERVPETIKPYEIHRTNLNHYYHCYHRHQYEVKPEVSSVAV